MLLAASIDGVPSPQAGIVTGTSNRRAKIPARRSPQVANDSITTWIGSGSCSQATR